MDIPNKVINYIKKSKQLYQCSLNNDTKDLKKYFSYQDEYLDARRYLQDNAYVTNVYWRNLFNDFYMENYRIISKLMIALKGNYYEYLEMDTIGDKKSFFEFCHGERPYGNKNIVSSVIFYLGIDIYDILSVSSSLPKEIENMCINWHNDTIKKISNL